MLNGYLKIKVNLWMVSFVNNFYKLNLENHKTRVIFVV